MEALGGTCGSQSPSKTESVAEAHWPFLLCGASPGQSGSPNGPARPPHALSQAKRIPGRSKAMMLWSAQAAFWGKCTTSVPLWGVLKIILRTPGSQVSFPFYSVGFFLILWVRALQASCEPMTVAGVLYLFLHVLFRAAPLGGSICYRPHRG